MAKESDLLREAMDGTEREIFAGAFGKEDIIEDESGDKSLESLGTGPEGQHEDDDAEPVVEAKPVEAEAEAEAEEPAAEAQAEPEPQATTQAEPQGRVPAGRLREEAEARRKVEAERDAIKAQFEAEREASQKAIADLNAKFEAMMALARQSQPTAQPQTPTAPPQVPDLFENPTAFADYLKGQVKAEADALRREQHDHRVNTSLATAQERYGKTYEEAFATLKSLDFRNPDNVALVQRMEASPNPGETLVAWHRRNTALREIGGDLDGYKSRVANETRQQLMADPEFRKELLASLKAEAMVGDNGRPRTETRLPPSLSRGAGNAARMSDIDVLDGSDMAGFEAAFR